MRVRASPALFLTPLLVLLAGCSGGGAPQSQSASHGASDGLASANDPASGLGQALAAGEAHGIVTATYEANWTAGEGATGGNILGSGNPLHTVEAGNLTGVVVEMAWTPSTPLSDTLRLQVFRNGGRLLDEAAGASPLRLAFPGDGLAGDELILRGAAEDGRAFVQQGFTFYVTSFAGVPFDASYSAVPA